MAGESCWQCGTVLSASGGRCPMCGAEQPPGPAPKTSPAPAPAPVPFGRSARPAPETPPSASKKALPWVVLAVGLLAIGVVAVLLAPHPDKAAPPSVAPPPKSSAPIAPPDPNDMHVADPTRVDPLEVLPRARERALAWQKDAALVSIRAEGVAFGRVNLTTGGSVEYTFGKRTAPGFGPTARISGKRLRIALGASGTTVDEQPARDGAAAADPTCQLEDAESKAEAAGVKAGSPISATYEVSEKYKKAVWRIWAEGRQARTVDGWSCVILVR